MADSVDLFVQELFDVAPKIGVVVDRADDPSGETFIDVSYDRQAAQVSYRPTSGFGLFRSPDTFGQRPDEICKEPHQAAARLMTLLAEASDDEVETRIADGHSPKSPAVA